MTSFKKGDAQQAFPFITEKVIYLFLRKIDKIDAPAPDDHWLWLGAIVEGYGRAWIKRKPIRAHRLAWVIFTGKPIPDGHDIHHRCNIKHCVNPFHLQCVDHDEHATMHREKQLSNN